MKLLHILKKPIFILATVIILFFCINILTIHKSYAACGTNQTGVPVTVTGASPGATTCANLCVQNNVIVTKNGQNVLANSTDCVETNLGLGNIDLSNFFPKLSFDDLISSITTILLAVLVIFFGVKVMIAGYKWINNDAQDKSKKEAIKSMTNGMIGIVISFSAYFVVLFIRSVFGIGGSEQLVNCSSLYFSSNDNFYQNFNAGHINNDFKQSTSEFQRCIKLAGKDGILTSVGNYQKFVNNVNLTCGYKYYTSTSAGFFINDKQKLNQCFIDELNKL